MKKQRNSDSSFFVPGKKYVIFIPPVQRVLLRHKISHQRYDILCARVLEAGGAASDFDDTLLRLPRSRNR